MSGLPSPEVKEAARQAHQVRELLKLGRAERRRRGCRLTVAQLRGMLEHFEGLLAGESSQ